MHPAVGNRESEPVTFDTTTRVTVARWQNPGISVNARFDVSNDQFVTPLDALLIINDLNKSGGRQLPSGTNATEKPPPYFDVSGDGFLSAINALLVIDFLNQQVAGGEGETPVASSEREPGDNNAIDFIMSTDLWNDWLYVGGKHGKRRRVF